MANELIVRRLGRIAYEPAWHAMQRFTRERGATTPDEFWCLEHPPVFTLGRAGRRSHLHATGDIQVVPVDRGGQVTYHGPGQIMIYTLVDLRRVGLGVRGFVETLENGVIDTLAGYGVVAANRPDAPGVYVAGRKIAALGLRVRQGAAFHGLALNVDCDLTAFDRIDPCGYEGLEVTSTQREGITAGFSALADDLVERLSQRLGYSDVIEGAATLEPA